MNERRSDARFAAPPRADLQATLRPGCAVSIVDLSAGGALLQSPRPLRPGSRVHLQVRTNARRYVVAASVLRCMVWALDSVDGVLYRGALKFEHRVDWLWAEGTRRVQGLPEHVGPTGQTHVHDLPELATVGAAPVRGR